MPQEEPRTPKFAVGERVEHRTEGILKVVKVECHGSLIVLYECVPESDPNAVPKLHSERFLSKITT